MYAPPRANFPLYSRSRCFHTFRQSSVLFVNNSESIEVPVPASLKELNNLHEKWFQGPDQTSAVFVIRCIFSALSKNIYLLISCYFTILQYRDFNNKHISMKEYRGRLKSYLEPTSKDRVREIETEVDFVASLPDLGL